jgi:hypothetical protein
MLGRSVPEARHAVGHRLEGAVSFTWKVAGHRLEARGHRLDGEDECRQRASRPEASACGEGVRGRASPRCALVSTTVAEEAQEEEEHVDEVEVEREGAHQR